MANPFPAKVVDDNGITRLEGVVNFTDSGNQPGGTFNGGTITAALKIVPSFVGTYVLELDAPTADGSPVLKVIDSAAAEKLTVTDDGSVTMSGVLSVAQTALLGGVLNSVQLYLTAGPAQASPIVQMFDKDGNTPFQFDKDGRAVISVHSAPADGALAAGECALWFDQTNGAAKLMVKGKSANGTVVAAAIALT